MNVKALLPLVAGLGIGGVALKIGLDTLQKAKASAGHTAPAAVRIWAADADIPRGAAVREEWLKAVEFPTALVPKDSLQDKEQLLGRVARIDVPAGLPVLDSMLLPPGEYPGVLVRPGYRAVAVRIDESSGVDFHLEPGCRVDVVGFFTVQGRGRSSTVARTFLENVEVAAVGPRLSPVASEEGGRATRQTRAVTLLVKPEKVPMLHLAEQRGKIKLCMRGNTDEQEIGELRPISDAQLIDPLAAVVAADEPSAVREEPPTERGRLDPDQLVLAAAAPMMSAVDSPVESPWKVVIVRGAGQPEVVRFKGRLSRERVDDWHSSPLGRGTHPAAHGASASRPGPSVGPGNFIPPISQPPVPLGPAAFGTGEGLVGGDAGRQPEESGLSRFLDIFRSSLGGFQIAEAEDEDFEPEEPQE